MPAELKISNLDDLIRRYQGGESLKHLSDVFRIGRWVIRRRFKKCGIDIRGRSDAERLKWSAIKKTRSLVERQCANAWITRRNSFEPLERRIRRAKTMMKHLTRIGRYETEVAKVVGGVQQFAIGRYNLDVALPELRIAIEITGAVCNLRRPAALQRHKYLIDSGWSVLYVFWRPIQKGLVYMDTAAVRDNFLTFSEITRSNPSQRGCYRMIRGDGQLITPSSLKLDHWS